MDVQRNRRKEELERGMQRWEGAETRGRWKGGKAREIKNRSKMEEKTACVRLGR